jgi:hypothetical protein
MALNAMAGRKGKPSGIHSDRAGTFSQMATMINHNNATTEWLNEHGISWKLIPTEAHNLNGNAEAMVKITKQHLERISTRKK